MKQNIILKAGGVLIKDRKILLERHGGNETYIIPRGKLEKGESAKDALIREFDEEFALKIDGESSQNVGTFTSHAVHNPDKIVEIETFIIQKWSGKIILRDGIEDVVWVNSKNIKNFKISDITEKYVIPLLVKMDLID